MKKVIITLIIGLISIVNVEAQVDTIKAVARYSFYTTELFGEVIINIPDNYPHEYLSADIFFENKVLVKGAAISKNSLNHVEFPLDELNPGKNTLKLFIKNNIDTIIGINVNILRLEPKLNEVKIDHATGGLIVDDLPFFPFGFYCYWPVQPTLPEEEFVKGFNMISPYQEILSKTLEERKNYMDRCAQLGMKVHYNLLSLAGGGGVGFDRITEKTDRQKRNLLISEIETFRDHPALLAWYISDEPASYKVPPEKLYSTYKLIKELDPYHPVSMVFMAPDKARSYTSALDIVMADPYPIPQGSVMEVNRVAKNLCDEFFMEKAIWIVPQAFGGSEWWLREPTSKEIRVMTYLALINNSTGIQYFIRHGLNSFPKSIETWDECGAIAREVAELTPGLLSIEPNPLIETTTPGIKVNAWKNDSLISIIAVNTINKPADINLQYYDNQEGAYTGDVNLIFENRKIPVIGGVIKDMIDAFGTRVYQIDLKKQKHRKINPSNLVFDPGFEDNPSTGTPAYCYAKIQEDRGAGYFIDSRVFFQGRHSLRLSTPKYNEGMILTFFPISLKKGKTYELSVWAKALKKPAKIIKQRFLKRVFSRKPNIDNKMEFKLALAGIDSEKFTLSTEWEKYSFSARLSNNGKAIVRGGPVLTLISEGTAWFDLIELVQIDE